MVRRGHHLDCGWTTDEAKPEEEGLSENGVAEVEQRKEEELDERKEKGSHDASCNRGGQFFRYCHSWVF
jgi:hypothetical protein